MKEDEKEEEAVFIVELLGMILSYVDDAHIVPCRLVNRKWNDIIVNPRRGHDLLCKPRKGLNGLELIEKAASHGLLSVKTCDFDPIQHPPMQRVYYRGCTKVFDAREYGSTIKRLMGTGSSRDDDHSRDDEAVHSVGIFQCEESPFLHPAFVRWVRSVGCDWGERFCSTAAANGHISLFFTLRLHGCPLDGVAASQIAARSGHVAFLDRLVDEKAVDRARDYTTDAILGGQVRVMNWILEREKTFDISSFTCRSDAGYLLQGGGHMLCAEVAHYGNLDLLKHLRKRKCPWNHLTCEQAAIAGNIEVLRWALDNGCPRRSKHLCTVAARSGQIEVLAMLRGDQRYASEFTMNVWTFIETAEAGNIEVLEWLRANGCPWNHGAYSTSALAQVRSWRGRKNKESVDNWLAANGCPRPLRRK